jgi:hypothetical protein
MYRMNPRSAFTIFLVAAACAAAAPAMAQWLSIRLPATPRNADGTPDLAARAPRAADGTPDLSGIWMSVRTPIPEELRGSTGLEFFAPKDFVFPMQPWARELYDMRHGRMGAGRPSERCLPHGIPDAMLPATPFKIAHTPGLTLILYEQESRYRQVFTDGRTHPVDPNPTWLGYSIGRWNGDTFIVETSGFNDRTWLDDSGHPHTDALRTTERFRRRDFGHMTMEITIDDAKAYTRPWSITIPFELLPDTELIENICENEKDATRLQ